MLKNNKLSTTQLLINYERLFSAIYFFCQSFCLVIKAKRTLTINFESITLKHFNIKFNQLKQMKSVVFLKLTRVVY